MLRSVIYWLFAWLCFSARPPSPARTQANLGQYRQSPPPHLPASFPPHHLSHQSHGLHTQQYQGLHAHQYRSQHAHQYQLHPQPITPPSVFVGALPASSEMFRAEILVPLYVYPTPGAWTPLFDGIAAHPTVRFTVIVNPHNGPGPDPLPDPNYVAALQHLTTLGNQHNNVRIVGYVATTYATKPLEHARADINRYIGWVRPNIGIRLDGVFFDETPSQYVVGGTGSYFHAIHDAVKAVPEFGDALVIHNPGQIPDPRFALIADVVVVFEQTYQSYRDRRRDDGHVKYANGLFGHLFGTTSDSSTIVPAQRAHQPDIPPVDPHSLARANMPFSRTAMAAMIHSCPPDLSATELELLVADAQHVFAWLFFTDLETNYYAKFSSRFGAFVAAVNEAQALGLEVGHGIPNELDHGGAADLRRPRFRLIRDRLRRTFFPDASAPPSPTISARTPGLAVPTDPGLAPPPPLAMTRRSQSAPSTPFDSPVYATDSLSTVAIHNAGLSADHCPSDKVETGRKHGHRHGIATRFRHRIGRPHAR